MTAPWQNHSPGPSESTDFREYVRPIWAHKFMILVLVVVVTGGTYWHFNRQPRTYSSSTQLFVGSTGSLTDSSSSSTGAERALANQAVLLRTPSVAVDVAKDIGYQGNPGALLGAVSVTPSSGTDFITISATAGDPVLAAKIANGFAKAFIN